MPSRKRKAAAVWADLGESSRALLRESLRASAHVGHLRARAPAAARVREPRREADGHHRHRRCVCAEDHKSAPPPACAHGDGSSWVPVHVAAPVASARCQPSQNIRCSRRTRAATRFRGGSQVGVDGRRQNRVWFNASHPAGVRAHDAESPRPLLRVSLRASARVGNLRARASAAARVREPRRGGRASPSSAGRVPATTRARRRRLAHTVMAPRAGKCT